MTTDELKAKIHDTCQAIERGDFSKLEETLMIIVDAINGIGLVASTPQHCQACQAWAALLSGYHLANHADRAQAHDGPRLETR